MSAPRRFFRLMPWPAVLLGSLMLIAAARGEDPAGTPAPAEGVEAEMVHAQLAEMKVRADADVSAFEIPQQPVLSYSDPARGYAAAGLWRIGRSGRPLGFVSVEYWNAHGREPAQISMEFLSMTDTPFELADSRKTLWTPRSNGIEFHVLEGLPAPAGQVRTRLRQFKMAAQRFSMSQRLLDEPYNLRLLPNPIDRYEDADQGIIDAAAFVFAYGTNPEGILLIECTEDGWRYGVAHTSSAELTIMLDRQEALRLEEMRAWELSGAHSATWYKLIDGEFVAP